MKVKFTILAVCATLIEISLAQLSPSTSEIRSEALRDWAILGAYGGAATFQAEKAIQRIFNIERLIYASIAGLESAGANVESLYSENDCMDSILIVWRGTMNATLDGALTVNPPASSGLITARAIGYKTLPSLVESLCGAMKLALTDKSSETSTQIQAMADKEISGAATYNAAVFAAVQTGITFPTNIEAAALKAQKKSIDAISSSLKMIFDSIKTFLVNISSENQTRVEDVYSAMEAVQNQAQSDFNLYIKINFDFFRSLSLASYIIQDGTIVDLFPSAAIDKPAACVCQKPAGGNFPQCTSNSPEGAPEHQSEMMADFCAIQAGREGHISGFLNGLDNIFTLIKSKLADFGFGKQSVGGAHSYNNKNNQAQTETFLVFKSAVDALLSAIEIISPESPAAFKTYRFPIYNGMKNAIKIIYDAIQLADRKSTEKITTQIKAFEKGLIHHATDVGEKLTIAIRNCQGNNSIIEPAMARAQERIRSEIMADFGNVIAAIKILLVAVFRSDSSTIERSTSAIEVAHYNAISAFNSTVDSRFFMIDTLFLFHSSLDVSELSAKFSEIQSIHKSRIAADTKSINIIFTTIRKNMAKVPRKNEDVSEDDKREIETASEETYTVFKTSIDFPIDSIYIVNPEFEPEVEFDRNSTYSALKRMIDNTYAAIELIYENDSSEIETKFEALRNATISEASGVIVCMYNSIINVGQFSATIEASIESVSEEASYQMVETISAVFDGIGILLGKAFPGIELGNEDGSSSIDDALMRAITSVTTLVQSETILAEFLATAFTKEQAGLTDVSCSAKSL